MRYFILSWVMRPRAALLRGTAAAYHRLRALPRIFFAISFFFNMITASSSFSWASSSTRYNIVSFKNPMASLTGSLYGLAGCPSSYDVLSTPDDDLPGLHINDDGAPPIPITVLRFPINSTS